MSPTPASEPAATALLWFARAIDRHPLLAAVLVALADLVLKHRGITRRSLWLDEAWTAALGLKRASAIVVAAAHDQNPPLYVLLVAAWLQLSGTSELALRLPSLLASAACAVALLSFVRRFYGAEPAAYASLLFLVSAAQAHYATEARSYALVGLLCVLSFQLFLDNLARPRWRSAIALGVVNAAALYVHYTIGLAYVAQAACALAFRATSRRAWRLFVASQLLAFALFLPFVPFLLANMPSVDTSWLAAPDLTTLGGVVRELVGSRTALHSGLVLIAGTVIWRLYAGRRGEARRDVVRDQRLLVAAAWATLPVILAFVISQRSPILYVRYELFAGLGWIVLMSALLAVLPWRPTLRAVAALLFVFVSAKASPWAASRDPEWRAVAAHARRPDVAPSAIVVVPSVECIPFAYYAAPDALPHMFRADGRCEPSALHRALAARRIVCVDDAWAAGSDLRDEHFLLILAHLDPAVAGGILRELRARGHAISEPQRIADKSIYAVTRPGPPPHVSSGS